MVEEIKTVVEEPKVEPKTEAEPAQPKESPEEFKIAEIWFRKGRIMLDAPPQFYYDKLRAYGILEMCRQIVENMKFEEDRPNIIRSGMNGLRNFLNRKKR